MARLSSSKASKQKILRRLRTSSPLRMPSLTAFRASSTAAGGHGRLSSVPVHSGCPFGAWLFSRGSSERGGLTGPERLILASREVDRCLWRSQPFDPVSQVGYLASIPPSSGDELVGTRQQCGAIQAPSRDGPNESKDAPSARWHALAHLSAELRQAQATRVAKQIQRHFELGREPIN